MVWLDFLDIQPNCFEDTKLYECGCHGFLVLAESKGSQKYDPGCTAIRMVLRTPSSTNGFTPAIRIHF